MGWSESILLECARSIVPADLCRGAHGIGADKARLAVAASSGDPFDTYTVAKLQSGVLGAWTKGSNGSNSLMTTNLALLCRCR